VLPRRSQLEHQSIEPTAADLLEKCGLLTDVLKDIIPFEPIVTKHSNMARLILIECAWNKLSDEVVRNKAD
jgi:hypothetical protein